MTSCKNVYKWCSAEGDATSSTTPVTNSCRPSVSQAGRETTVSLRWCSAITAQSLVSVVVFCVLLGVVFYPHADLPLLSWLQHTTGPASTMPLATNDWSPVAYFAVFRPRPWMRIQRCHYKLTCWFLGAQEINAWSDYGTNHGHALSCDSIPLIPAQTHNGTTYHNYCIEASF